MEIKTVTYQCPNCSAALEYNNALGKFKCLFCDSEFTEEDIKKRFAENEGFELSQENLEAEQEAAQDESNRQAEEFAGASALYTCPNCGAGVICDSLTASTRCHFCHTPVILTGRLSGEFRPNLIIPFTRTREQAETAFKEYCKGKFLLPKGFASEAQIQNITPLYVPYWLKSGTLDAFMEAEGHKVHSWRVGDTRFTNTKIFNVTRRAEMTFVRVPCDGSKRIDDSLMESIEPFDYTGIKPFSMSYLSGCGAEKYDVTVQHAGTGGKRKGRSDILHRPRLRHVPAQDRQHIRRGIRRSGQLRRRQLLRGGHELLRVPAVARFRPAEGGHQHRARRRRDRRADNRGMRSEFPGGKVQKARPGVRAKIHGRQPDAVHSARRRIRA